MCACVRVRERVRVRVPSLLMDGAVRDLIKMKVIDSVMNLQLLICIIQTAELHFSKQSTLTHSHTHTHTHTAHILYRSNKCQHTELSSE